MAARLDGSPPVMTISAANEHARNNVNCRVANANSRRGAAAAHAPAGIHAHQRTSLLLNLSAIHPMVSGPMRLAAPATVPYIALALSRGICIARTRWEGRK